MNAIIGCVENIFAYDPRLAMSGHFSHRSVPFKRIDMKAMRNSDISLMKEILKNIYCNEKLKMN